MLSDIGFVLCPSVDYSTVRSFDQVHLFTSSHELHPEICCSRIIKLVYRDTVCKGLMETCPHELNTMKKINEITFCCYHTVAFAITVLLHHLQYRGRKKNVFCWAEEVSLRVRIRVEYKTKSVKKNFKIILSKW